MERLPRSVRLALVPGALALGAALGCASLTGLDPLPKSEDVRLGRAYATEIQKQLRVEKDATINAGIAAVGSRILLANGIAEYEFDFQVVRDDRTVNAFALPGGKIYVFSGLIARADDESELAGVLAHEIAHVTERHSSKRLVDQLGVQAVTSILLGRSGVASSAAAIVTKLGFLSYSRSQEADADEVGLGFIARTDYDPRGMVRFFEKIRALESKDASVVGRFLSDHPRSADRIADVEKRIAALPPERRTGNAYAERWLSYRARVCPGGPPAREAPGAASSP